MADQTDFSKCLTCSKTLIGRADKKFCSDQCRNNFNNKLRYSSNNYIRNVNNALRKNRRILEEIIAAQIDKEKITVPKVKLADMGFRFKYITHIYTNKKGSDYYFCYDYGYLHLESDWFLIVKRKEE